MISFPKHIKLIEYDPDDRDGWLKLRKKVAGADNLTSKIRLGGSDLGVVLGLSDFKSAGSLFYEFLGLKESKQVWNQHTYRGHVFEQTIKDGYWRYLDPAEPSIEKLLENAQYGKVMREYQDIHAIILNEKYPNLFGNIDGAIPSQLNLPDGILEIKAPYQTALEKWEGDIAPQYIIQGQDYMLVTELDYCEIFALADMTMPYAFSIYANEEIQKNIIKAAEDFCDRVYQARQEIAQCVGDADEIFAIANKYEPEPEATPVYIKFLKEMHKPENKGIPFNGDQALLDTVLELCSAKNDIATIEENDVIPGEVAIRQVFHDQQTDTITFDGLTSPGGRKYPNITWKKKFYLPYKKFLTIDE